MGPMSKKDTLTRKDQDASTRMRNDQETARKYPNSPVSSHIGGCLAQKERLRPKNPRSKQGVTL